MNDHQATSGEPSLSEITNAAETLAGRVIRTPVAPLASDRATRHLPADAAVAIKLELFQHAGSFKARGALLSIDALSESQRQNGVTAVSAGNHALAVAWACRQEHVSAKLVMPKRADPVRVSGCQALGAEVVLVEDIHAAFSEMDRIASAEGRTAVHPFEGRSLTLGTATCGLEFVTQQPDLDMVVVPVGGGGLISGVARAVKLTLPGCRVIGVEPYGADAMFRSLQAGRPLSIPAVDTIADSLGSPTTLPYSFAVARANVDEIVRIHDQDMLRAMAVLYDALKIAAEPACAATTAALMGPLRETAKGLRVGVIGCGSNIGERQFADFLAEGRALLG